MESLLSPRYMNSRYKRKRTIIVGNASQLYSAV
jgi:hypothetical protein